MKRPVTDVDLGRITQAIHLKLVSQQIESSLACKAGYPFGDDLCLILLKPAPGLGIGQLVAVGQENNDRDHGQISEQIDDPERPEFRTRLQSLGRLEEENIKDAVIDKVGCERRPQAVGFVVEIAKNDGRD